MNLDEFSAEVMALRVLQDLEVSEATEIVKAYQLKRIADALGK
jgi:hypothetical protein